MTWHKGPRHVSVPRWNRERNEARQTHSALLIGSFSDLLFSDGLDEHPDIIFVRNIIQAEITECLGWLASRNESTGIIATGLQIGDRDCLARTYIEASVTAFSKRRLV
jgi:hypothetical protein